MFKSNLFPALSPLYFESWKFFFCKIGTILHLIIASNFLVLTHILQLKDKACVVDLAQNMPRPISLGIGLHELH